MDYGVQLDGRRDTQGTPRPAAVQASRRGDQELGRRAESSLRLGGGPRGLWRETEDAPALMSFGAEARSLSPLRRGSNGEFLFGRVSDLEPAVPRRGREE